MMTTELLFSNMNVNVLLLSNTFYFCRNIGMRNYKRKTQRKNLTDAQRKEIKEKVNNGESRRSLAGMYGVSEKTIRNYLKKVSLPFIY